MSVCRLHSLSRTSGGGPPPHPGKTQVTDAWPPPFFSAFRAAWGTWGGLRENLVNFNLELKQKSNGNSSGATHARAESTFKPAP